MFVAGSLSGAVLRVLSLLASKYHQSYRPSLEHAVLLLEAALAATQADDSLDARSTMQLVTYEALQLLKVS